MINIEVDLKRFARTLNDIERRQLPFAISNALNETAKGTQQEIRAGLNQRFTIKRKAYAERSIKIPRGGFATKRKLQAEVRLETPGASDTSDILGKFERGGTKRPKNGGHLVINRGVRMGTKASYQKNKPSAYNWRPHGRSGNVMVGDRRTVMIKKPGGKGGIFQRKGRGKRSDLKLLFSFVPKGRIDDRLRFEDTAARVVKESFPEHFRTEFAKAMQTAR